MTDAQQLFRPYADEVRRLVGAASTTEETYYPAIKGLLTRALEFLQLPFEARTSTSELRAQRGLDLPDFALYDGPGEFLVVCGEVKLPDADLRELAFSEERNNQIGRYLVSPILNLDQNAQASRVDRTDGAEVDYNTVFSLGTSPLGAKHRSRRRGRFAPNSAAL